jgi:hypothetical protein
VDNREERGVSPDAEREGEDSYNSESRVLPKDSQTVADVLP